MTLLKGELVPHIGMKEMDSLVERYPYSHVLRLARVTYMNGSKDINLDSAASETAVHVPNRAILHDLYGRDLISPEVQKYVPESEIVEQDPTSDLVLEPNSLAKDEPEVIEEEKPISDVKSSELEKQYLSEAVQSSIALEVDPSLLNKEPLSAEKPEKQVPTSFLDFISGQNTQQETASGIELIDDFLKETDVERTKTEFFDPEKMAKKSLDDSEGLVSDTLARIYVSQGNYAKAIDAYDRLILKYPEKSGYFAARIEKVKDLQRIKRK